MHRWRIHAFIPPHPASSATACPPLLFKRASFLHLLTFVLIFCLSSFTLFLDLSSSLFWVLLTPPCVSVACRVIFPCWGASVEGEGEGSRGQHLRQPLSPLPCCHPPSVTSDCPLSFHHPHLDEPPHKDRGLP